MRPSSAWMRTGPSTKPLAASIAQDPAPCQQACPAGNDISYALWLIEKGQFLDAAEIYRQTSSLPEVCGRVCPQERLCQSACVRGKEGGIPVPTGALEAFTTHYERRFRGVKHSDRKIHREKGCHHRRGACRYGMRRAIGSQGALGYHLRC